MRKQAENMHAHLAEVISGLTHAGLALQSCRPDESAEVLHAVDQLIDLQRLVSLQITPEEAMVGILLAMVTDDASLKDPVTLEEIHSLLERQGYLRSPLPPSMPCSQPALTGAGKALIARLQAL